MDNQTIQDKIDFVSNNNGTSIIKVFLVLGVPVQTYFLYSLCLYAAGAELIWTWKRYVLYFVLDQIYLCLPMLLAVTLLAEHLLMFTINLFMAVIFLLMWLLRFRLGDFFSILQLNIYGEYGFVTNYKSSMQIMTCICILAVDFNVFPRQFGKTETNGVSVMDLGVGLFIFSMALTSKFARFKQRVRIRQLYKTTIQSLVLVSLGIARVILVKSSNYQEHVSEYGLHWNFFFTLASVKTLSTFLLVILPFLQKQLCYLLLSLVLMCSYQYGLTYLGLSDILQFGIYGDDSRISFLDANREGIISCVGYLSIYFLGLFFGGQLFKIRLTPFNKICWMMLWFIVACLCLQSNLLPPISRRMVNVSYYFLILAVNLFLLFGYCLGEAVIKALCCLDKKVDTEHHSNVTLSNLSEAVSDNLLLYFLIGNVFTGLVNVFFDTLNSSDTKAFLLLSGYLFCLNFSAMLSFMCQRL